MAISSKIVPSGDSNVYLQQLNAQSQHFDRKKLYNCKLYANNVCLDYDLLIYLLLKLPMGAYSLKHVYSKPKIEIFFFFLYLDRCWSCYQNKEKIRLHQTFISASTLQFSYKNVVNYNKHNLILHLKIRPKLKYNNFRHDSRCKCYTN